MLNGAQMKGANRQAGIDGGVYNSNALQSGSVLEWMPIINRHPPGVESPKLGYKIFVSLTTHPSACKHLVNEIDTARQLWLR
jgi:hypothetical protein